MQVVSGLLHPLRQLHGRSGLVFNPKGDFAVRVHIEKLRPGVLEHRADFSGDLVHGQLADLLSIHQYAARQFSRIELWDQAVDQPCDGGLAASAPAAEQDALSIRNRQIDVVQAVMLLALVGKRHMLQFNHPNTPFQYSPTARYAAKQTPARRSAGPM